jgi:hypothetical protein
MAISLTTMLSRHTETCHAVFNAQVGVIFVAGECYALNSVAVRILELIEQPVSVEQLCIRICEEFEVDRETCERAILDFATEMVSDGVVQAFEVNPSA